MLGTQPNVEVELMSTAEDMWFAKTAYTGLSEKQSLMSIGWCQGKRSPARHSWTPF
jgi:hypothetical protein